MLQRPQRKLEVSLCLLRVVVQFGARNGRLSERSFATPEKRLRSG